MRVRNLRLVEDEFVMRWRRDAARLKREISYFCGVIARTESRQRIQAIDSLIRRRESELMQVLGRARDAGPSLRGSHT